jgi:membrane protein required for colicin V production
MALNTLDWVIVVFAVFCLIRGVMRGAVSQVFGIAGLLAGFVLASNFYEGVALKLAQTFPQVPAAQAVSFGILFFLSWLCVAIAGFWVSRLVQLSGLAFWDRAWGGILGAGKAFLFAVVLVSFLAVMVSTRNSLLKDSLVAPYALESAQWLMRVAPENLRSLLEKKGAEMKRYPLDEDSKDKGKSAPRKKEGQPV